MIKNTFNVYKPILDYLIVMGPIPGRYQIMNLFRSIFHINVGLKALLLLLLLIYIAVKMVTKTYII